MTTFLALKASMSNFQLRNKLCGFLQIDGVHKQAGETTTGN